MTKLVVTLLTLMMVLGLTPPAMAEDTSAQQIVSAGGSVFYDAEGRQVNAGTLGQNGAIVEMSKTIAGTDIENEFVVTLQVKTTQDVREFSSDTPDAAVTLVIDVSNSMDDCLHCGKEASHNDHEEETQTRRYCSGESGSMYYGGSNNWNTCYNCGKRRDAHNVVTVVTDPAECAYASRLSKAQEAAIAFVEQFANDTGAQDDDARYVSLISFGSDAATRLNYTNVRTDSGMSTVKTAIQNLTVANTGVNNASGGGTNIEGGLMLADNLLTAGLRDGGVIEGIDYLYTILLTDGNPTFHVSGSSSSTTRIDGQQGGGDRTTQEDVEDVGNEAADILAHSSQSKLYSVCFGTVDGTDVWNTRPFGNWNGTNPQTTNSLTVGQWLEAFSTQAYNGAGDATDLFTSFNSIITQIQLAAEAWIVNDTMGEYMAYGDAVPVERVNNVVRPIDGGFAWDIRLSGYDPAITTITENSAGNFTGVLGYTYKYTVTLDNLDAAYHQGYTVPANHYATLDYAVHSDAGDIVIFRDKPFEVPTVKGLTGTLRFQKVHELNGEYVPIGGMNFRLEPAADEAALDPNATTWAGLSAQSGADGWVEFTGIPSGHDYRLIEDAVHSDEEDNYVDLGEIPVSVDWGVVTPEGQSTKLQQAADSSYFVVNEFATEPLVSLTLVKAFATGSAQLSPIQFTVTGNNFSQTVTLSPNNGWTATLENLKAGDYTISEISTFENYDLVDVQHSFSGGAIKSKSSDERTIVVELKASADNYNEYSVTFTNDFRHQMGTVTVNKSFWEHQLASIIAGTPDVGLVRMDGALYENLTVLVDFYPVGSETSVGQIILTRDDKGLLSQDWSEEINLSVGEYTMKETIQGTIDRYHFSHTLYSLDTVEVTNKGNVDVSIANHYTKDYGHIRVTKSFSGLDAELFKDKTITVNVASVSEPNNVLETLELTYENEWHATTQILPVGEYILTEVTDNVEVDGYTHIAAFTNVTAAGTAIIEKEKTTNIGLTNTYSQIVGDLEIKKVFEGVNEALYEGLNILVNVIPVGGNTPVGQINLSSDNKFAGTLENLPQGDYTIKEIVSSDIPGYTSEVTLRNEDGAAVKQFTIPGGEKLTMNLVNTYTQSLGSIHLTKAFAGLPVNAFADKTVTVRLYNSEGSEITNNGNAAFILNAQNNWEGWVSNLPVGRYTLVEDTSDVSVSNYKLDVSWSGLTGAEVVVEDDKTTNVGLTNTYTLGTGSITIEKRFQIHDDRLTMADFKEINLQVTSEDGTALMPVTLTAPLWSATISGLPAGNYTVSEISAVGSDALENYDLTTTYNGEATGSVTVSMGNDAKVQVLNAYEPHTGTIAVAKSFFGDVPQELIDQLEIRVYVNSADTGTTVEELILTKDNGWAAQTQPLPVGEYYLVEDMDSASVDQYDVDVVYSPGNSNRVDLGKGETVKVGLANYYSEQVGQLLVKKIFKGDLTDELKSALDVVVTVKDAAGAVVATMTLNEDNGFMNETELEIGEYTLEETAEVVGFVMEAEFSGLKDGKVIIDQETTVEVDITNTYKEIVVDTLPKTGDDSRLTLWMLALAFSALGMAMTIRRKKAER